MSPQWQKTQYTGVRFREHPSRKHQGKPDRYFSIRFKIDGKLKEEALGWASEGWNAQKASLQRSELRKAQTTGEGPQTLADKRRLKNERLEANLRKKDQLKKENVTFIDFFNDTYYPISETNKKLESCRKEQEHFKNWLKPVLGDMPLKKIVPLHLEKVKRNLLDAGRSPRTIQYVFATFRQCWNMARRDGIVKAESPTKRVKIPTLDNKRERYLSPEEADALLKELQKRSGQLYQISMLSLYCGCRASEIFRLKWGDVDTEDGTIRLLDTKNRRKSRTVYMTADVKEMFLNKAAGGKNDLVFPDRNGQPIRKISNAFNRAVDKLGFNQGVTDRRQRVVFHSLRHTFASWLAQDGADLFTISKLLGHSTLATTERYAHLSDDTLRNAVRKLEQSLRSSGAQDNAVDIAEKTR